MARNKNQNALNEIQDAELNANALNEIQDAPMQDTPQMVDLKIECAFTDKNTKQHYLVGDVVSFDEARANELLSDSRKLVSRV